MPSGDPTRCHRFGIGVASRLRLQTSTWPGVLGHGYRTAFRRLVSTSRAEADCPNAAASELASSRRLGGHTSRPRRAPSREQHHVRIAHTPKRWNPKQSSHTPLVLEALIAHGSHTVKPYTHPRRDLTDFQYISPYAQATTASSRAPTSRRTNKARAQSLLTTPNLSYKSILATYLEKLHGNQAHTLEEDAYLQRIAEVFSDEVLACLEDGGFNPTHVVTWAWILSPPKSVQAAARLYAYSNRPLGQHETSTPTFLLQMILLRKNVSAPALRLLLINSFDRLANVTIEGWRADVSDPEQRIPDRCRSCDISRIPAIGSLSLMDQRPYPGLTETAVVVLTIRLIRHARKAWPELLPEIARLFTSYVIGRTNRKSIQTSQLSFIYNKMLLLLSHPSTRFFKQIKYHQQAQMIIVRAMGELEPPVLVDRTGYRAVASIQLAHAKTPSEIDWASRKAKSWPPWQEARLGIDEEIGEEAGVSRTGLALSQLAESGYRAMPWEDAAGILAGWDTDHSPTIQTRGYFPPTRDFENSEKTVAVVWAARIRATRTLEEAWAIFLSCQSVLPDAAEPYLAMAEKLLGRTRMRREDRYLDNGYEDADMEPLPGDLPENFEPSKNPKDRPYLGTPVPTLEEFMEHAEQHGVHMGDRLLVAVLERSRSYTLGRRALRKSRLSTTVVDMVLGLSEPEFSILQEIDERVLLAILRWQTFRFDATAVGLLARDRESALLNTNLEECTRQSLLAFKLHSASRTTYAPAWTPLFRALTPPSKRRMHLSLSRIAWRELKRLTRQMDDCEIDRTWGQFIYLCRTFSLANIAGFGEDGLVPPSRDPELVSGAAYLKSEFEKLTGSKLAQNAIQSIRDYSSTADASESTSTLQINATSRTPNFNELHMLIQALGLVQDHQGVLEVATWIEKHRASIQARHDDHRARQLPRRCMVAIRVFVEGLWDPLDAGNPAIERAAADIVEAARDAIDGIAGAQVQLTDEEIGQYRPLDVATHPEAMLFASPNRR